MADAETRSRAGGLVDKIIIVTMIVFVALPFSAHIPLLTFDEHARSVVDDTAHEYTGSIGIMDAKSFCRTFDETAGEWIDCDMTDDDLEERTKNNIGDLTECKWTENYATDENCKDERQEWCRANQGLGWTSIIVLLAMLVSSLPFMMTMIGDDKMEIMYITTYGLLLVFTGVIFGLATYYTESASNECGFDQSERSGTGDYYGWGELGVGAYLLLAVAFVSLIRMLMLAVGRWNLNVPQRAVGLIYLLILGLSMAAMFTPIVTITTAAPTTATNFWVQKIVFYPFQSTNNTKVLDHDNYRFMEPGHCTYTFDSDTDCSYKEWCTNTQIASFAVPILAFAGALFALYVYTKDLGVYKMTNAGIMLSIFVFAAVHGIWTAVMIGHTFELGPNKDDHKCGFNHLDGSDGAGASVGLMMSVAIISLLCFLMIVRSDESGVFKMYSLQYKLVL